MSATSVVEKATSDMLIGPDWALNLDLCDAINNEPSQAREIVKAVKKRLTNRNPQVQLLALTVLETLIKNCGDNVHQQVAEKDVLHELVKIVKKKADMRVRDKTLVLLDSWQEAFGGAGGRYPQYYMAYNELQKVGVEFPRRGSVDSVPIFTPPQSQPIVSPRQPPQFGHWSPRSSTSPNPEPVENLPGMSLTDIQSAQGLVEVLQEMLSALNPKDRMGAKDEVIVELVDQCRTYQQRVMQLVNTTSDEELLRQGLSLNDDLQRVLARHEAILSGAPLPEVPNGRQGHTHHAEKGSKEDSDLLSPRILPRIETQSSSQGSPGMSRPKSARTIFPTLAPPPSNHQKANVSTSSMVSAVPLDAKFDLLSGDTPNSASSAPPVQAPPAEQQQKQVDLLALPGPEENLNPFESSPFQAIPMTQALVPVTPPQHYNQQEDIQMQPSGSSDGGVWSPSSVTASPRQQSSMYGELQPQSPVSVSGQPAQSQQQYYYGQPQPVVTTPPPWQEDPQSQPVQQQWQGASQTPYSWAGANTLQPWGSAQQQPGFGPQQSFGSGVSDFSGQNSGQYSPSFRQLAARGMNEPSRLGSVGSGPGDNFGSLYLQQRGSAFSQSSGSGPSQQPIGAPKSVKSPDTLFNDLVDLRSVNAKFKGTSLVNKAPNTSKAGP